MGTPRSKNVSSDIATYQNQMNKFAFITFFMVVQHMLMVAVYILLVVQHMLRFVQHICDSVRIKLSQLLTKLKLKLKLNLAIITFDGWIGGSLFFILILYMVIKGSLAKLICKLHLACKYILSNEEGSIQWFWVGIS